MSPYLFLLMNKCSFSFQKKRLSWFFQVRSLTIYFLSFFLHNFSLCDEWKSSGGFHLLYVGVCMSSSTLSYSCSYRPPIASTPPPNNCFKFNYGVLFSYSNYLTNIDGLFHNSARTILISFVKSIYTFFYDLTKFFVVKEIFLFTIATPKFPIFYLSLKVIRLMLSSRSSTWVTLIGLSSHFFWYFEFFFQHYVLLHFIHFQ